MRELSSVDISGKKVLVRVDFNVPMGEPVGSSTDGYLTSQDITDDGRIRAALPTIEYLLSQGCQVVLLAHLGRPKAGFDPRLSLRPVAERLSSLLGQPVKLLGLEDTPKRSLFDQLGSEKLGLAENIRFDPRETSKADDERGELARELAQGADLFVSDGFGVVHRKQASVTDIASFLPAVAGLLVGAEMKAFDSVLNDPKKPYVVILGGAKVSDKIDVIKNLLEYADIILIGGAMAYTFLRAQDVDTGMSLVENDKIDEAKNLLAHAADKGVRVFLPSDVVVARGIFDPASAHLVPVDEIPATGMGLDIGPATVEIFADQIRDASTVVWNGPMGVFEQPAFAKGTQGVAQAVADCQGFTVIGGGDTASAIRSLGLLDDRFSHVSTGGGASLELLEGKKLPGLSILSS